MNKYKWTLILITFLYVAIIICLAMYIQRQEDVQEIIGPFELQELLNELEPENPIKVDGRIGPKTIEKWERVYCNQSALKTFKR